MQDWHPHKFHSTTARVAGASLRTTIDTQTLTEEKIFTQNSTIYKHKYFRFWIKSLHLCQFFIREGCKIQKYGNLPFIFCFYSEAFPWKSIKDKVLSKMVKKLYIAISYNLYISLIFYVEPMMYKIWTSHYELTNSFVVECKCRWRWTPTIFIFC